MAGGKTGPHAMLRGDPVFSGGLGVFARGCPVFEIGPVMGTGGVPRLEGLRPVVVGGGLLPVPQSVVTDA